MLTLLLSAAACRQQVQEPDHQAEWRHVLEQKRLAVANEASAMHKQAYADSLVAFVRRHPDHSRAREVYHRVQLEFADELMALGRYRDAIRFYRSVLTHDETNEDARRSMAGAAERLAVAHDRLEQLEKGMSRREVVGLLGRPIPGWSVQRTRRGSSVEAWYYRTTTGGIAGVYFRDGEVFAAEANSDSPLGP